MKASKKHYPVNSEVHDTGNIKYTDNTRSLFNNPKIRKYRHSFSLITPFSLRIYKRKSYFQKVYIMSFHLILKVFFYLENITVKSCKNTGELLNTSFLQLIPGLSCRHPSLIHTLTFCAFFSMKMCSVSTKITHVAVDHQNL